MQIGMQLSDYFITESNDLKNPISSEIIDLRLLIE